MKEAPNLSYLEEIAGEDRDFEQKFIKLFKEEFLWEVGMYMRYIENKEPRAAAEIVAKSKYKMSMLGLQSAFHLAVDHEEKLNAGDASLHWQFKHLLQIINNFLESTS